MEKFLFADGQDVCIYDNGKITKFPSKFIEKYKNNSISIERNKKWKHSGEGAQFRGDFRGGEGDVRIEYRITGVFPAVNENEAVYAFTVNDVSGIYSMRLDDEKAAEIHIINSLEQQFSGGCLDVNSGLLATSVARNDSNSDIAIFDIKSGDYKLVTDGDTLDEDPYLCPENAESIYFSSRGAGRDAYGGFVGYSPAAICRLDLGTVEVEEVLSSDKYSYLKPVKFGDKLYVLRTPAKVKGANPVAEILLIPFRILQAIANFINAFVHMFTGKSLVSGGENPAKSREYDSRKEFVKGNIINAEKELKRNRRKKESDYGFIPLSWQLIEANGGAVIKSGIGDFDILSDGTIIATNGKHIFAVKDGKCKKLCDTEHCLKVGCRHASAKKSDVFES